MHHEDVPALCHTKHLRVCDTSDGHSDMSQSSGDKSSESQDYESNPDEDNLCELNSNELACTFNDEVRLFILMRCMITQVSLGSPMGTETLTVVSTHLLQQQSLLKQRQLIIISV